MKPVFLRRSLALVLSLVGSWPAVAAAQAAESGTFYMIARGDTIMVEPYTRGADRVSGELVAPKQGSRRSYTLDLTADAGVTRTTLAFYRAAADTAPAERATLRLQGDTMIAEVRGGTQRLPTQPGAITYVNPSMAILEQALMHARRTGQTTLPLLQSAGGQTMPLAITWIGGDSAALVLGGVAMRAAVAPDGHLLGATVPSQQVTVSRVSGLRAVAVVKPDYSAPAGAPYDAEEVVVRTPAGITLAGTLTLPKARPASGAPAVVMITGSGPEERDETIPAVSGYRPFRQIADTLSRRGIAVLRLDDRGTGGSATGPADPTSADFADDIRAALAWLRARPGIDGARLGLVGHSEGGMIAPMIAATDPALKGIVLLAGPSQTGRQILAFQRRYAIDSMAKVAPAKRDSALAASQRALDSVAMRNAWIRFFLDYDPKATARRVKTPVLILQGATDQQVTPDQAPELAKAFRAGANRDVTLRVFPGTNHLFLADASGNPGGYSTLPSKAIAPEVLGTIADWLGARLR